jgi:rhamnose transport system ATP-binding protein
MGQSIANNIVLPSLQRFLDKFGLVKRDEEERVAETYRTLLSIRAASVDVPTASLSGGNQQKVVISKWLETHPKVLILDEPTRGIDVGAKVEVHQLIDELAGEGMAIMLISSDLPEVLAMSDRILIMREGHQMAILDHAEANQEKVLTLAMGQAPELEDADARAALQTVDALIDAGSTSGD